MGWFARLGGLGTRFAGIAFLVGAVVLGGSLVIGFWKNLSQGIGRLPLALKISLGLGAILIVLALIATWKRWWPGLKLFAQRSTRRAPASSGLTFMDTKGATFTDSQVSVNIPKVGVRTAVLVTPLPPIPTTRELLQTQLGELKALTTRVETFLARRSIGRATLEESEPPMRDQEAHQEHYKGERAFDSQTWRLYVQTYDADVVAAESPWV